MNSSDWIGLGGVKKKGGEKENEFQSELENDGNGKRCSICFSHQHNNRINPSNSPLNPRFHNEFDVLDVLDK